MMRRSPGLEGVVMAVEGGALLYNPEGEGGAWVVLRLLGIKLGGSGNIRDLDISSESH
jgi:hypothetical protein